MNAFFRRYCEDELDSFKHALLLIFGTTFTNVHSPNFHVVTHLFCFIATIFLYRSRIPQCQRSAAILTKVHPYSKIPPQPSSILNTIINQPPSSRPTAHFQRKSRRTAEKPSTHQPLSSTANSSIRQDESFRGSEDVALQNWRPARAACDASSFG